jgi:arabinose-5-phosphate isomerase
MRGFTETDFANLHPGGSLGKRLSLRVSEIMKKGDEVPVVSESTSIKDTIIVITSKRLGVTAVVNEDGLLSGIITDGDLRRLLERTLDIKNLRAVDIMSRKPKVIAPVTLASFALQTMENYKITSLIVADQEKPVGILHLHDLVNLGLKIR